MNKHSHYFKNVSHLQEIDVYRVLALFAVTNPCLQHAVKKILCCGVRGLKDSEKDVAEAIISLQRFQEMQNEDFGPVKELAAYDEFIGRTHAEVCQRAEQLKDYVP